jgi:hypothetical protein
MKLRPIVINKANDLCKQKGNTKAFHKTPRSHYGHQNKCKTTLTTETVEGAALSLESVDDIERCDSLALGVLSVGDGITNDTLEEGLENTTGLLVDH